MAFLSDAVARVQPSATVRITDLAREMGLAGRDVISLSVGEPDFDTPQHVKDAAIAAINAGKTKYTAIAGIIELREAVAAKFRRDNGLDVSAADCFVSSGGKQILFNALLATLNVGDEVVVPAPYWVSYPEIVRLCGATPIVASAGAETGFRLLPEVLEAAISPRTKWLLLNSPSNPTGAAYSADELLALAEVLRRYEQVHVLSDDIYEPLIYDGGSFATLAQVAPDLAHRCVTMNGVSKSHAMTGWRIGYCAAPPQIIKAMNTLQSQSTTHASSISQWAAVAALNGTQGFLDDWRGVFQRRRDLVVAGLREAGLECLVPQGAFYVFPSCKTLLGKTTRGGQKLSTDEDFAVALLAETGVALVHGTVFGMPGHFRLSYATSDAVLEDALSRISDFCSNCS